MTKLVRAVVALGSNLGNREAYLDQALEYLSALPDTRLEKASSRIETEPVEVPEEFRNLKFINQVAIFLTSLEVHDFSRRMHEIEDILGRVRSVRNGPRTIDLDLIDFDGIRLNEPDLILPHPRWSERSFVKIPLEELHFHLTK